MNARFETQHVIRCVVFRIEFTVCSFIMSQYSINVTQSVPGVSITSLPQVRRECINGIGITFLLNFVARSGPSFGTEREREIVIHLKG